MIRNKWHTTLNLVEKMQATKKETQSGFPLKIIIEATGLEPTASASRTQRSTKLSHASKLLRFPKRTAIHII